MKKVISILLFLSLTSTFDCGAAKNGNSSKRVEIREVSAPELMRPKLLKQYANQTVSFTARFEKILVGFDEARIRQYKMTHFLISLVSEDGITELPIVLAPAGNKLLPTLRSGDLMHIEANLHIASTDNDDDFVYLIATKLTKVKSTTYK